METTWAERESEGWNVNDQAIEDLRYITRMIEHAAFSIFRVQARGAPSGYSDAATRRALREIASLAKMLSGWAEMYEVE